MTEKVPFYRTVTLSKTLGGKRPLWHARKEGCRYTGASGSADGAIADLQKQIRAAEKRDHAEEAAIALAHENQKSRKK